MLEINWHPSRRELRQFGAAWLPLFGVLVGGVLYRGGSARGALVVWALSAATALVGLAKPHLLRPVFVGWMAAAYPIGWIVSHVVLAVTYYGLFTAVAVIMRLVRFDPLERARSASRETYWAPHEQRSDPSAYFRQF